VGGDKPLIGSLGHRPGRAETWYEGGAMQPTVNTISKGDAEGAARHEELVARVEAELADIRFVTLLLKCLATAFLLYSGVATAVWLGVQVWTNLPHWIRLLLT